MNRSLLCAALLVLGAPTSLRAQDMGQGQAQVTTRANVRLSLESVPGTGAARLAHLGRAVGTAMPSVRQCYDRVIADRPGVAGTIRMKIDVDSRGRLGVDVEEDEIGESTLIRCISRVLTAQTVSRDLDGSAGMAVLELDNSAAAGVTRTEQAREEAFHAVEVIQEEGHPVARGIAPGVRFEVSAEAGVRDELVAEAFRVIRSQVAGMLDCRRRASRREMNPEGELRFRMRMRPRHRSELTQRGSTVHDERAPRCMERAFERAHYRPQLGPGVFQVVVRFLASE